MGMLPLRRSEMKTDAYLALMLQAFLLGLPGRPVLPGRLKRKAARRSPEALEAHRWAEAGKAPELLSEGDVFADDYAPAMAWVQSFPRPPSLELPARPV